MASALIEKDNRTFQGQFVRWIRGCAGSHRVNPGVLIREAHKSGDYMHLITHAFPLLQSTIQHHEVSTNAHGIPFLVRYTLA
jgi:hypothetical protein